MKSTPIFSPTPLDNRKLNELYSSQDNLCKLKIDKVQHSFSLHPSILKDISQFPEIDLMLGLEVELERVNLKSGVADHLLSATENPAIPASHFFFAKEDTSLRNNGMEFVSFLGLTGQQILSGLYKLFVNPGAFAAMPDTSVRTSVHVHVNVLPYTFAQYRKILFWYLCLEDVFFRLSGNRNNNIYCVPWRESMVPFLEIVNAQNFKAFNESIVHGHKYSALNTLTTKSLGTIEFRHHKGTFDYSEIENWMIFLYQFITAASGDPNESLNDAANLLMEATTKNTIPDLVADRFGILVSDPESLVDHIKDVFLKCVDANKLLTDDMVDNFPPAKPKKSSKKSLIEEIMLDADDLYVPTDFTIGTSVLDFPGNPT